MLRIKGTLDDVAFDVQLTGDARRPVQGSRAVAAQVDVAIAAGRTVLAGPSGPRVPVAARDPRSIALLLAEDGRVASVDGDLDDQRWPSSAIT